MFTTKLTRVAHRATTAAASSNPPSAASHRATQCLATRARPQAHQRRVSSSKATPPSDSSQKPAPAAKASTSDEASQSPASAASSKAKRAGRIRRPNVDKGVRSSKDAVDQFAGLPAVPAIRHLDDRDLRTSSFFSLHRPLSLTTTIPPPAAADTFASIFEPQKQQDPWENGNSAERRPEDVIYTLHNTIHSLDSGAQSAQDEGVRWEIMQESASNSEGMKQLDGPPKMKSLDEIVAHFKPFNAPPPPETFVEEPPKPSEKKKATRQAKQAARQKSYATTIVVTESTTPDGQRTYTASSSPIVRLPDVEDSTQQPCIHERPTIHRRPHQPFLERMRKRHQANLCLQQPRSSNDQQSATRHAPNGRRGQMLMISVRRQRKLKMKKHKYKKLMKRTRNLRRRLDRN